MVSPGVGRMPAKCAKLHYNWAGPARKMLLILIIRDR
jgi:hypothetical protein